MRKATVCFFVGLFGLLLAMTGLRIDNDTWYLLALGRSIAAEGLTPGDPLLLNLGYPIIDQQWLYALGLWKVYALSGLWGIFSVSMAAGFLTILLFYRLVFLVSGGNRLAAYLVTGIAGLIYGYTSFQVRPWMFSNLLCLLAVFLLEQYARRKRAAFLVPLPFISVLLVNLHGALWPFLLILMVPYVLEALVPAGKLPFALPTGSFSSRPLLLAFAACLLAGFFNPYGIDGMLYSIRAQGIGGIFRQISEMQPLTLMDFYGVVLLLLSAWLFFCYARQRADLRYLLLSLGTFVMMMMAYRSSQQFLLFGFFPMAWLLRGLDAAKARDFMLHRADPVILLMFMSMLIFVEGSYASLPRHIAAGLPAGAYALGVLLLAIFLWALRAYAVSLPKKILVFAVSLFWGILPLAAAPGFDAAAAQKPELRAAYAAVQDAAQKRGEEVSSVRLYADFHTAPMGEFLGCHPLVDTRPELRAKVMTHGFDYWKEYSSVQQGMIDPLAYLDRYDIECVVVGKKDVLYYALAFDAAQEKWALFYEGKDYRVFCRR